MSRSSFSAAIATLGTDLGKNSFHLVGQDARGAIVLRIEFSRPQLAQRLANLPRAGSAWKPALALTTSAANSRASAMTCA